MIRRFGSDLPSRAEIEHPCPPRIPSSATRQLIAKLSVLQLLLGTGSGAFDSFKAQARTVMVPDVLGVTRMPTVSDLVAGNAPGSQLGVSGLMLKWLRISGQM